MAVSLLACSSSDSGGGTTTTGGASASSGGATASTGGASSGGASAGGASTSTGGAAAVLTGSATNGAMVYAAQFCASCHGTQGEGGIGANISSSTMVGIGSWTETQFHDAVRSGKSKSGASLCTTMARYSASAISDQALADLYAFLLSTPANNTVAASAQCMTK